MYNQYQEWDTVTYAKAQIQNDQDKLHLSDSVGFSVLHPSCPASLLSCMLPVLYSSSPTFTCIHPVPHGNCPAFTCPTNILSCHPSVLSHFLTLSLLSSISPVQRFSCSQFLLSNIFPFPCPLFSTFVITAFVLKSSMPITYLPGSLLSYSLH